METDKDILKQIDHRDGMTVPEGYFADFAARMAENLPSTPFETKTPASISIPKTTTWGRLKPYVYMAAMFMGVWCMLKMFTLLTTPAEGIGEISPTLAEAINNDDFYYDYIVSDLDQYELIDDLIDEDMPIDELNLTGLDFEDSDLDSSDSGEQIEI